MALISSTGRFSPLHLNGCAWWLEADRGIGFDGNGNVNSWGDQSGNGRTVTQRALANNPVYTTNAVNGYPALTFDGTRVLNLISGTGPLNFMNNKSGGTFIIVTWSTNASATQVPLSLSLSNDNARVVSCLNFWVSPGWGGVRLDADPGGTWGSGTAFVGLTIGSAVTNPTILTGVYNYTTPSIDLYVNGTKTSYAWQTQGNTSVSNLAYIIVGCLYHDTTASGLVGRIALICGWERCLSYPEIQKLHQFYGQKYNIAVTL